MNAKDRMQANRRQAAQNALKALSSLGGEQSSPQNELARLRRREDTRLALLNQPWYDRAFWVAVAPLRTRGEE